MSKAKLLIIEDDDEVRTQMKWALAAQYEVLVAEDRPTAVGIVKEHKPELATLDLGLPPRPGVCDEGLLTLSDLLQIDPLLKVMVVTGQGEKENGVAAIGEGAFDFLCKPVDIEVLKVICERALRISELEREQREGISTDVDSFEGIIGKNAHMQTVFARIRKTSASEAPVLIIGESGTGKELAASAIHRLSARSKGPFVAINCGAIPAELLESELFGHEKGAFTSAHTSRQGRLELADGGTLFLDEIGDLPHALQVKLLRFLQERQIERVGGRTSYRIDTRVIAATNVDLRRAMSEGRFREDLYYRLAVVILAMPPLRDRDGDILLLANTFLQQHASTQKKNLTFTQKSIHSLQAHTWPGNVRELENRIQRAAIMAENGRITPDDLELTSAYAEYDGVALVKAREALERHMIESAITRNNGNMSRAAAALQISRPRLYEMIEKLGILRK